MVFGNMGDTSATGVAFTRNPSTGEKGAVRRIPHQRAGRGRGRRHPHAAGDHRGRPQGGRLRQAFDGEGDAGGLRRAGADLPVAREALPRHAGPRIHGREGQAVDAADALRQAHRQGRAAHRGRARERGARLPGGGGDARRSGGARPAAASDHRSESRAQRDRDRPAGFARRRLGRDRVLGRRSREPEGAGQEGDPGAGRDLAGRHSRHARRRRHPDHARRHDLACGGGRARHGQALRLRRRLAARRLCGADDVGCRQDLPQGRDRHHRRLDRPGARRPRADARAGALGRVRHADGMGRQRAQAEGARQCRHAERRARRAEVRRRRHRPLPHRAHVLRGRPHPRGARDDPRRRREGPPRRARQAAADAARRLHRAVRDHAGPAGHDPAARSAAARVPAAYRRGDRRGRGGA